MKARMSLLESVEKKIINEVDAQQLPLSSFIQSMEEVNQIVTDESERTQLIRGIDYARDKETFRKIWAWVKAKNGQDIFIKGWLGESKRAYESGVRQSCYKGFIERVVMATRGIDKDIDLLFAKVEGPEIVKRMFASMSPNPNDIQKRKALVKRLALLNAQNIDDAKKKLKAYLLEQVASYHDIDDDRSEKFVESLDDVDADALMNEVKARIAELNVLNRLTMPERTSRAAIEREEARQRALIIPKTE